MRLIVTILSRTRSTVTLGTAVEISAERILPASQPSEEFNYVGLEHVQSHTGEVLPHSPTFGAEIKSTKNIFHHGQILYGKLRPYLNKVHLACSEGICSTDIFVLQPKRDKVHPAFMAYYLRSPLVLNCVNNLMQGANLPRLSPDSFLNIPICLPPLPEQHRIVGLLDQADELRRRREQADRRTADLIPALFYEMFGDPAKNPKGWEVKQLGEVGKLDRGRSRHRPRDEASLYGGSCPFIQTGDVTNSNGLITEYSQTYSALGLAQSRMWPAGTLCITIAANIAKTGILTFEACFPDSIVGFIPHEGVLVEYVREWFVTMEAQLDKAAPQAAQKNINLGILNSLRIPIPPSLLQRQFGARVAKIGALQARQAESRRRLDDLLQSMLHRAFQGEL